jgi:hypothetical protein
VKTEFKKGGKKKGYTATIVAGTFELAQDSKQYLSLSKGAKLLLKS